MSASQGRQFKAALVRTQTSLHWTIVSVPRSVTEGWNAGARPRVRGRINGFAFRTSLLPTGKGDFTLLVNKRMQTGAGAAPGSIVTLYLEPDPEGHIVAMPPELKEALAEDALLRRWYERLPPGIRKYVSDDITQPKSDEARIRRAQRMSELLLSIMEGERTTPPILEAAFAHQPLARQGWKKMTAAQRRGHLWGIYYYKSPESRRRRTAQAVEDALRIAGQEAERKRR
jgi:uncharacterized protein YdeI (YjbR/CyaY-like superfamily)